MRIEGLNLAAFGPFTDQKLDLGPADGKPCIVVGRNEAGKSSALRAITALLFGIPVRSPDDFLHDYKDLRIGARLSGQSGDGVEIFRRKGRSNTLLGPDGQPVDDGVLRGLLGGVEESVFAARFGIDHMRLRAGGQELLEARGDVAETLFGADLGISDVRGVIKQLDDEARALFVPRGQNQVVPKLLRQLKQHKADISAHVTLTRDWQQIDDERKDLEGQRADIAGQLETLRRQRARCERLAGALPLVRERGALVTQLEPLADAQPLPEAYSASQRREALGARERATRAIDKARDEVAELTRQIAELEVPERLLEEEEEVRKRYRELDKYLKEVQDIPDLWARRVMLQDRALELLQSVRPDIALEQADTLKLTTARRARIQRLARDFQRVVERRTGQQAELRDVEPSLDEERRKLDALGEPVDTTDLEAVLASVRADGPMEKQLAEARATAEIDERALADEHARLPLWTGTTQALLQVPLPSQETLNRFDKQFDGLELRRKRLEEQIEDRHAEISKLGRALDALMLAGAVPSEAELVDARSHRDGGWGLLRQKLGGEAISTEAQHAFAGDQALDQTYEEAVAQADRLADRLRREADRVARRADLEADIDASQARLIELQGDRGALDAASDPLDADWRGRWPDGVEPGSPREMTTWCLAVRDLRNEASAVARRRGEVERMAGVVDAHRRALIGCFDALGAPFDAHGETLVRLVDRAEHVCRTQQELRHHRQRLSDRVEALQRRVEQSTRNLDGAQRDLHQWRQEWRSAIEGLQLVEEAGPEEVDAVVQTLDEAFKNLGSASELDHRIKSMRRSRDGFELEVRKVIGRIEPSRVDAPPGEIVPEMERAVRKASEQSKLRRALDKQVRKVERDLARAQQGREDAAATLALLCRMAGCDHEDDLDEAERRSTERLELSRRQAETERALLAVGGGSGTGRATEGGINALIEELSDLDQDELEVQRQSASEESERTELALRAVDERLGSLREQMSRIEGGDRAARAHDAAHSVIAELRERARQYSQLRVAWALLRREIERHRARTQGPALSRAADLFAQLTEGSFARLDVGYGDTDEPVIEGVRPDGTRVRVEGMSDGTRDQLYLALRLAFLERYLTANEPLPFIIDDILVHFDDVRAAAALRVLAELARRTQVVFFTHHEHLVDVAATALSPSGFYVRRLGSEGAGATA